MKTYFLYGYTLVVGCTYWACYILIWPKQLIITIFGCVQSSHSLLFRQWCSASQSNGSVHWYIVSLSTVWCLSILSASLHLVCGDLRWLWSPLHFIHRYAAQVRISRIFWYVSVTIRSIDVRVTHLAVSLYTVIVLVLLCVFVFRCFCKRDGLSCDDQIGFGLEFLNLSCRCTPWLTELCCFRLWICFVSSFDVMWRHWRDDRASYGASESMM